MFLLFIALLGEPLQAQKPNGAVTGMVTDPSGAVVPGAPVTILYKNTQLSVRTATSRAGAFTAPSLQPGAYEVRVEAPGFKKTVVEIACKAGIVRTICAEQQVTIPAGWELRERALRLSGLASRPRTSGRKKRAGQTFLMGKFAEGGGRTLTALRPQDPKSCASANSATSAQLIIRGLDLPRLLAAKCNGLAARTRFGVLGVMPCHINRRLCGDGG